MNLTQPPLGERASAMYSTVRGDQPPLERSLERVSRAFRSTEKTIWWTRRSRVHGHPSTRTTTLARGYILLREIDAGDVQP